MADTKETKTEIIREALNKSDAEKDVLKPISDEQREKDAQAIQEELQPGVHFPEDLGETWSEQREKQIKRQNQERRDMGKEDKKIKGTKKRITVKRVEVN